MFGCMAGYSLSCIAITHCILYIGLKRTGRKLELNDTRKLLLYRDLMDGNISVMNKYSELY